MELMGKIRAAVKSGLGRDVLLTLVAQAVVMLCSFGINKLVSLRLGVEGYAEFSLAKKSAAVFSYGVLGGMGIAVPRYLAIYRSSNCYFLSQKVFPASFLFILLNASVLALFFLLFPNWIGRVALGVFASHRLLSAIYVYAVALAVNTLVVYYYRGVGNYRRFNVLQMTTQALLLVVCIVLLRDATDVFYQWGVVLAAIAIAMMLFDIKPRFFRSRRDMRTTWLLFQRLVGYGLPRLFADLVLFASDVVPLMLVLNRYGEEATGYFSAAVTLLVVVTPLFSFTGSIFLQRISGYYAQQDFTTVRRVMRWSTGLYLLLAVLGAAGLALLARWFIPLLFSHDFVPAIELTRIMAIALIPKSLYLLFRNPIDAVSKFPYNLVTLSLHLLLMVVLFNVSSSLRDCAYYYCLATLVLGVSSYVSWMVALRKAERFAMVGGQK